MPYHHLPLSILRQECRNALETLERWLRRLVREALTDQYGPDFLNATDARNEPIVSSKIRKGVARRMQKNPGRYAYAVDATHLDELIAIVCRKDHYDRHFKEALARAFPNHEAARFFLHRLIEPRNGLSHENPVSVRQAEQVICYCNDVIEALKEHARVTGREQDFNVPSLVSFEDSLGNRPPMPEIHHTNRSLDFSRVPQSRLRVGDKLRVSVEVDASFSEDEYDVDWWHSGRPSWNHAGKEPLIDLTEGHISQAFTLYCKVTSKLGWHRFGTYDDLLLIVYRVMPLPP